MRLKCNKCGNTKRFYGSQACRGTVSIVVDGDCNFITNQTDDGELDSSGFDFDDPEGPWECAVCNSEDVEESED